MQDAHVFDLMGTICTVPANYATTRRLAEVPGIGSTLESLARTGEIVVFFDGPESEIAKAVRDTDSTPLQQINFIPISSVDLGRKNDPDTYRALASVLRERGLVPSTYTDD